MIPLVLAVLTGAAGTGRAAPEASLTMDKQDGRAGVMKWEVPSGAVLRLAEPVFTVAARNGRRALPVELREKAIKQIDSQWLVEYELVFEQNGLEHTATYCAKYAASQDKAQTLLRAETQLHFKKPCPLDITVSRQAIITGQTVAGYVLPQRNGIVKNFAPAPDKTLRAFYTLGRGAAQRLGHELAMPLVGLQLSGPPNAELAVAADPYCGIDFRLNKDDAAATVTFSTTYKGSLVPVTAEQRTIVFSVHAGGIDRMLDTFYLTVPDIEPGAPWIHDIQLNYYDYLGQNGRGWYDDLNKLAQKIPPEARKSVVACLHGWYDYLGRYAYDRKRETLDDEWIAFPNTRKTPMSKTEIHKRLRFARQLGFRCVLYFADGLNSALDIPDYPKGWIYHDENGNQRPGWTGPSTGRTTTFDPSNPEVRRFYLGYTKALLEEYGREIDGLVWDETFYIAQEAISSKPDGRLAYTDRDFMTLVAEIVRLTQQYRRQNPDLVFLTSDLLLPNAPYAPYALVSHGTYQDTAMAPAGWPIGMLPNYRNCLWSCNWYPVNGRENNRIGAEIYGVPQGLSNGYGDNIGPAAMAPKLLDEVIQRFFKRTTDGARKRYLTEPTVHTIPNPYGCTTKEDAAGGCDGVKTGKWGFCTSLQSQPWWQVDLGRTQPLDRVVIFNRCDSGMDARAAHLIVLLSTDGRNWTTVYRHNGKTFFGHTDNKPLSIPLAGAKARFLRIQLPATDYLHFDEVEIYQTAGNKNLALNRPADQSSTSPWSAPTQPPN